MRLHPRLSRRVFLSTLSAIGAAIAAPFAAPEALADDVSDALAELAKARAGLQTLSGPFTQERAIGLLSTAVKSEGELTLVSPDRLRWELKPPDAITYWITPEGLAYVTPSGGGSVGKAAAGRFGAVLGDLLTFIGGDLEKLRARYDLAIERPDGAILVTAKPRADEVKKQVKSLSLRFAPNRWAPQRMVVEEASGDRSVITFGVMVRDAKIDPAKMTPPRSR